MSEIAPKVGRAVPFFAVRSIEESMAFYVHGLGFTKKNGWFEDGVLRR